MLRSKKLFLAGRQSGFRERKRYRSFHFLSDPSTVSVCLCLCLSDPFSLSPSIFRRCRKQSMENSLFCDEALLSSPPSSPAAAVSGAVGEEEGESLLRGCLRRQHGFLPREDYVEKIRLSPDLSRLRLRAARWIVVARLHLDLALGTAFSAVNLLDRFVSMYTNLKWEGWMMELLSLACLSIAAKFDEVVVSSLHSFPVEDFDHSFHPNAIQRMELTVLRALDWRLNCVTAYSYVGPLTCCWGTSLHPHLRRAVCDRTSELLAGAILDLEFLQFSPCVVALSATRCALEELALPEPAGFISDLISLIPHEHIEMMEPCHRCMEERVADPLHGLAMEAQSPYSAASPVTVIVPERGEAHDGAFDIGVFSEMDVPVAKNEPKRSHRRKRKKTERMQD